MPKTPTEQRDHQPAENPSSSELTHKLDQLATRLGSDRVIWLKDGKEMVRVPAGVFLFGDERQEIELPEFWIDKTPVTNAEYAHFVTATGHDPPEHWRGRAPAEEIAEHPVVYVSFHDAVAYANWAGKRLPTQEEWEKSARGTDGRDYPWGDQEPTLELCNFGGIEGNTTPVGKYSPRGDSPFGCADMGGNVWEWADTVTQGSGRSLRGGSWNYQATKVRVTTNHWTVIEMKNLDLGFRCAWGESEQTSPSSNAQAAPNMARGQEAQAEATSRIRHQWRPVKRDVVAACQGDQEATVRLTTFLDDLSAQDGWRDLATVLYRVLQGERDAHALLSGLDPTDTLIVTDVLQELGVVTEGREGNISLDQFLEMIVLACSPEAPPGFGEQLYNITMGMARHTDAPSDIRALGRVLNHILCGSRNPDVSDLPSELRDTVQALLARLN